MAMAISLTLLSTILFFAGLLVTRWIHSHYQMEIVVQAQALPLTLPAPMISVVVPARNEARNIRRSVEALLAQTYPAFEVIVVDDRSTDATPLILQELKHSPQGDRLRVVQGEELPPGWAGKPYAVAQGAALAQGRWFCFVDADTFASPQMLAATLATAQGYDADMFSMLTDQELKTFWEKVILPIIFTALSVGFPANRVNDPHAPEAIANGQFILIRREVYDVVGGHAAIRDQIAEDKALAELVKRCGYRLVLADGRLVARTRMYTTFAEIWEGWTKNIFLGMEGRFGLLLVGALVGLMGAFLLPVWLLGAIAWLLLRGGFLPAVALVQALLVWAYVLWLRAQAARAFHISPWYAFSFPLGTLAFTAMMFASAFKVLSGQGVTWKGRRYSG